jgi:hypothetical protein
MRKEKPPKSMLACLEPMWLTRLPGRSEACSGGRYRLLERVDGMPSKHAEVGNMIHLQVRIVQ